MHLLIVAHIVGRIGCGVSETPADEPATDTGSSTECHTFETDLGTGGLAECVDALMALPSGACGALIEPWVLGEPADAMRIWGLVADRSLYDAVSESWDHDWAAVGSRESWRGYGEQYLAWGVGHASEGGEFLALADGGFRSAYRGGDEFVSETFIALRERIAHSGTFDVASNHTWIRDGQFLKMPGESGWLVTGEMYVLVDELGTVPPGDLCVSFDLSTSEACGQERVGTFRIVGAQDVVVEFDGIVCDQCGTITIDGVNAGEVCVGVGDP